MQLKQYYLGCLSHASYMIGDDETKTAVVVDPQRDIDQYVVDADRAGFTIRHVFLTHFHADFVAGHIELQEKTGAAIHLGAKAEAEFPFEAMADGSVLEFGSVRLKVLETPGHTPEGISIVVFNSKESETHPKAVLTGDTLFIGDVGRPDLMASIGVTAESLASDLYDSLHNKLMRLPDDTLLYPAHGAGSMCGKNLSTDTVSTIGAQRQNNYALQPMAKKDFISLVTSNQPDAPKYFSYDAMLNRQKRETLSEALDHVKALTLAEVETFKTKEDAQLVDCRQPSDFAAAHMIGSLNIELEGMFATWSGTFLDPQKPIIIIADAGTEIEAGLRLGRIGFDRVLGYLENGIRALQENPKLVGYFERESPPLLAEQITGQDAPLVLDVRTPAEFAAGHIPGALNMPLSKLQERLPELPRDRRIVAACRTGSRSATALSVLRIAGLQDTTDLRGGIVAWNGGDRRIEIESVG